MTASWDARSIPVLQETIAAAQVRPLTLDELEKVVVPARETLFNTCQRGGNDRRQCDDRRAQLRDTTDRRGGRDRRLMTYL